MTEFRVFLVASASMTIDVTADSLDEAMDKAYNEAYVSLCHQCDDYVDFSDDWQPILVTDTAGEILWEERR